jgi:hypothetical protein
MQSNEPPFISIGLEPIELVVLHELVSQRLAECLVDGNQDDLADVLTQLSNKLGLNL